MLIFIRHGKKRPDGKLSLRGKLEALKLRKYFKRSGMSEAFVATNVRAEQTARYAGLRIVGQLPELAASEYEKYLNTEVIERMLAQKGKPWEKSFTRAVLEDPLYKEVFSKWGESLTTRVRDATDENGDYVFIGSSPLIELAYLHLIGSYDWQDFPRCQELEGFCYDPKTGEVSLITRKNLDLE